MAARRRRAPGFRERLLVGAVLHPQGIQHELAHELRERLPGHVHEKLLLDGFQAGLSWLTILKRREGFRQAIDAAAEKKGLTLLLDTELLVRTVEALHDGATMQSLLEPDALPFGTIQQEVIPRLLVEE